jgi:thiamine-phosphate pyrophosphorylase
LSPAPDLREEGAHRARQSIVCYVTDRLSLGAPGLTVDPPVDKIAELLGKVRLAVQAGADWVQIREKDLPGRALLDLTRDAIAAASGVPGETRNKVARAASQARVFVNDRLDVAIAAGAAGVHLGGESIPAGDVVRWCRSGNAPPHFEIGVSCHSLDDAREAERAGASYVFFGPVFDTPSKKAFGPSQGVQRLAEVCAAIQIPVIAIGGMTQQNAPACLRAGASGIAAIRMFQDAQSAVALRESVAALHK